MRRTIKKEKIGDYVFAEEDFDLCNEIDTIYGSEIDNKIYLYATFSATTVESVETNFDGDIIETVYAEHVRCINNENLYRIAFVIPYINDENSRKKQLLTFFGNVNNGTIKKKYRFKVNMLL